MKCGFYLAFHKYHNRPRLFEYYIKDDGSNEHFHDEEDNRTYINVEDYTFIPVDIVKNWWLSSNKGT